jgi:hypothetical protein
MHVEPNASTGSIVLFFVTIFVRSARRAPTRTAARWVIDPLLNRTGDEWTAGGLGVRAQDDWQHRCSVERISRCVPAR